MRVKMLTTAAGPDGPFEVGRTYSVPDEMPHEVAKAFLQANAADAVKASVPEVAAVAPVVEAAVVEPAEAATAPRQKAKR